MVLQCCWDKSKITRDTCKETGLAPSSGYKCLTEKHAYDQQWEEEVDILPSVLPESVHFATAHLENYKN